MRTANPALNAFQPGSTAYEVAARSNTMTLNGTVTASGVLLSLCAGTGLASWMLVTNPANQGLAIPILLGGMLGGLVLALITVFKPTAAPFTGPLYALLKGAFLGVLSFIVAQRLGPGGEIVVFQAIGLTFGIFAAVLLAYVTRVVRPGRVFRACIISATAGIMIFYVVALLLSLFGVYGMASLLSFENASMLSIGLSLFVVVIASMNLVLDFELIEAGVERGMPKHMEWYGAFALLVTLVWLYIEVLRLLAKLRSR
ncbi:MAG TPA: Bax inhibitor-1/YccA family protein [Phycisphaerales bacterium]|nr:Bax inhibitor-1/YccA family protein [Phycisphaerales bacterium]